MEAEWAGYTDLEETNSRQTERRNWKRATEIPFISISIFTDQKYLAVFLYLGGVGESESNAKAINYYVWTMLNTYSNKTIYTSTDSLKQVTDTGSY